ncbi:pyrin domain-containing protein 1 [Myotis lucifugus]|uniref:pyrin domain-containing protein 1 n=1 Tax=Myotis lucifugus TaxID=59463 RepID=UPI0003C4308C|nr:pyrin domain-containing protein 1 [Myotis lucifugus]
MGKKRDAILDALENLTADELKKFKLKLGAAPLREGFRHIPRGALGAAWTPWNHLTDKLVAFYCEDYGARGHPRAVLRGMGMQEGGGAGWRGAPVKFPGARPALGPLPESRSPGRRRAVLMRGGWDHAEARRPES